MAHIIIWHVAAAAKREGVHTVSWRQKKWRKKKETESTSDLKQMRTEWEGTWRREWHGLFLTFWKLKWVLSVQNIRATCSFCEITWEIQCIAEFRCEGQMQMKRRTAITTPEQLSCFKPFLSISAVSLERAQQMQGLHSCSLLNLSISNHCHSCPLNSRLK